MQVCEVCGDEYKNWPCSVNKRKTCSRKCMGIMNTGKGNPNFNNRWSDEQKKQLSDDCLARSGEISARVKRDWDSNPARREEAARIMQAVNPGQYATQRPWTAEEKIQIGIKSAAKWTPEFKKRYQQTMEDRGYRRPLSEIPAAEIYYRLADWPERMWDRITNISEMALFEELGIFNSVTNPTGVVRDHRFGRWVGFNEKVFPELLRHPANCEIISRSDNCRKFHNGDQSITINELFFDIENYSYTWHEQDLCLTLIHKFAAGGRYKQEDYK